MKKIICSFFLFVSVTIPVAHAARPIRGSYEVPVSADLKSFATYPVKFEADNYQQDPNTIVFPMPSTLIGVEQNVKMSKVPGQTTAWEGPNVDGNCETIGRYFKCTIAFKALAIDQTKVEAAIRSTYQSDQEIAGRLRVADSFGSEPIGIITYKMRGKSQGNEE